MSEEEHESQGWQPTPEFYDQDPKAKEIRKVCLNIIGRMHKLLGDPEVMENRASQRAIYASLERDEGQLIGLGVRPNMHVGKDLSFFQSSPLHTAEFVAGQLMQKTGEHLTSEKDIAPLVAEISGKSPDEEEFPIIKGEDMPDELADYAINTGVLWIAEKMLAAPEPKDED